MFKPNILLVLPVALLVASCGGGGNSDVGEVPCASGSFSFSTSWNVTGGSYTPSGAQTQVVRGKVGTQLSAKPVHSGIPVECVGKGSYTLGSAAFPLPLGLSLNPITGEISGLPSSAGDTTGGGTDTGAVRLKFPGYTSTRVLAWLDVTD